LIVLDLAPPILKGGKKKKNRGFVVEELDMSPGFLLECDSEHAGWW
jgi:hypothetical protein